MKKVLSLTLALVLLVVFIMTIVPKDNEVVATDAEPITSAAPEETTPSNDSIPATKSTKAETKAPNGTIREWKVELDAEGSREGLQVSIVASQNDAGGKYSPRVLIGDTIIRLNNDGTTTTELRGLIDAQCNPVLPSTTDSTKQQNVLIRALSLGNDGILVRWEHRGPEALLAWCGVAVATDVAEAKFGCCSTVFRKGDGLAYVMLETNSDRSALCLGEHDLSEVEQLWEDFAAKNGTPSSLEQLDEALRIFADECKQA